MAHQDEDVVEQTLYMCRDVSLYSIPPRLGAGGHKSGDWKVADKIFTGRLRVVSIGERCEVRLEDISSGELFATCPVPYGQRDIAVEQATDSSRNFVLRLVDATTGRHAFLGLGFTDRGDAFDFNVALSDHEKQLKRAQEAKDAQHAVASGSAASGSSPQLRTEAGLLYKKQDLSLKEGETITINVKKNTNREGGFLSQLASGSGSGSTFAGLAPPPPPGSLVAPAPAGGPQLSFPIASPASSTGMYQPPHTTAQTDPFTDLLSLDSSSNVQSTTAALNDYQSFTSSTETAAKQSDVWATFD